MGARSGGGASGGMGKGSRVGGVGNVQGTQESSRKASYEAKLARDASWDALKAKQTAQTKLNKAKESGNKAKIKAATEAFSQASKAYYNALKVEAQAKAKSIAETEKWMTSPEYKKKYYGIS